MRWKGIIALVIILAAGLLLSFLFLDSWTESLMESAGQALMGARVEFDGVDVNPASLSIEWKRLQVADPDKPMTNLVETGPAKFNLNAGALLRKRVNIETLRLIEVQSGTPRLTSGRLPKKRKRPKTKPTLLDKTRQKLTREVKTLPVMQIDTGQLKGSLQVDSLMAAADLRFPHRADSLKIAIEARTRDWTRFYKTFQPDEDLKAIQKELESIDLSAIDNLPELIALLETAQRVRDRYQTLRDTVDHRYRMLQNDIAQASSQGVLLKQWLDADYQRILALAKLPDLNATNIGKALFGPRLVQQVDIWLGYLQKARKIIPKKKEANAPKKPERLKGETIHFPDRLGQPTFLIQALQLSGVAGDSLRGNALALKGDATGITTQPWVYGRPTTLHLAGKAQNGRTLRIHGRFDHITESASDSVSLFLSQIPLKNWVIDDSRLPVSAIKSGVGDFQIQTVLTERQVTISITATASRLKCEMKPVKKGDIIQTVLADALGQLNRLTVQSRIRVRDDQMTFTVHSNLDEQVSQGLSRLASRSLKEAQTALRAKLTAQTGGQYREIETLLDTFSSDADQPILGYKNRSDALGDLMDEKTQRIKDEIEKKKNSESGKLEKKAKDLLDDLLGNKKKK